MKRALLLHIMLLTMAFSVQAQQDNIKKAIDHLNKKELDQAKEAIDAATLNADTKDMAITWHTHGFIYKELYKANEKSDPKSAYRQTAFDSFKKSMELDTEGKFTSKNEDNMKYLKQVFFNDAVNTLNIKSYKTSLKNFEMFQEASKLNDPAADNSKEVIDYKIGLATVYMQLYNTNMDDNDSYFDQTKATYNEILSMDPNNIRANYNMGVLYYNQAVNIIKNLEYGEDLVELSRIQDNCIKLFKQSLPYMEKAHKLDPTNINTLKGLSGIYYSLNEIDKSNELKATIEDLQKKQD